MPNQANYGQKITKRWGFRPRRIDNRDWELITLRDANGNPIYEDVTFGVTNRDIVEIWIYDDTNTIIAHTNLHPWDSALRLTKYVQEPTDTKGIRKGSAIAGLGQDETPDILEINWPKVMSRLGLPEGRYFATVNFFRDEVGSETKRRDDNVPGNKLFISAISPSRTELRLEPAQENNVIAREIREFVQPSVPPFIAQGIADQLLAHASVTASYVDGVPTAIDPAETIVTTFTLNASTTNRSIADRVSDAKRGFNGDTNEKITYARLINHWQEFLSEARLTVRNRIINGLQEQIDKGDVQIQEKQFQRIIDAAISGAMQELKPTLEESVIAGRISLIDM